MVEAVERIYLDNTMLTDYRKCPRYFYLRHVRDWTAIETRRPLIFGSAWHAAMGIIWQGYGKTDDRKLLALAFEAFMQKWIEEGGPAELSLIQQEEWNPRTPAVAAEMLHNYISERASMLSRIKMISSEQPFAVPIFADRDDVWLIGRKDQRVLHLNTKETLLIEHKTTTSYKKDGGFKSDFLDSFSPNSQLESYLYADATGEKKPAKAVWVDAALVHKSVHDKFKFIPISYATEAMDAFVWETRDWAMRILSEIERLAVGDQSKATHMTAFPKNDWSCMGKYGACQFLSVCRSIPNPAKQKSPPEGFVAEHWEPFDTLGLSKIMKR
jgi:hypothetical protein